MKESVPAKRLFLPMISSAKSMKALEFSWRIFIVEEKGMHLDLVFLPLRQEAELSSKHLQVCLGVFGTGTGAEWVLVQGGVLGPGTGVLVYLIICEDKTEGLGEKDRVGERQCCKGRISWEELEGRQSWV
ncbi:hypothetical protein BDN71DRAFT_1517219 [Pleurotus eryngii]|uniref:Uncharacterized protein n=1 Tax=Pleurotus eryngii TaxID=5323 RepID=A0A9P6DKW5_PLEER|nr:hypothetical protein BDN71DRAFT_1517219 [Pleurotus eryngii]